MQIRLAALPRLLASYFCKRGHSVNFVLLDVLQYRVLVMGIVLPATIDRLSLFTES